MFMLMRGRQEQSITTRAIVRFLKWRDKAGHHEWNQWTLLSKELKALWTLRLLSAQILIRLLCYVHLPDKIIPNKVSTTLTFLSWALDLPSVTICLHHEAISSNQVWLVPRRGVSIPRGYTKASRSDPCVKAHNCFLLKSPWFFFCLFFYQQDSRMVTRFAPLLWVTARLNIVHHFKTTLWAQIPATKYHFDNFTINLQQQLKLLQYLPSILCNVKTYSLVLKAPTCPKMWSKRL